MFGAQIDNPVTTTTPLKADPVATGAKIHGFQIDSRSMDPRDYRICIERGRRSHWFINQNTKHKSSIKTFTKMKN